jgi:iron(III) transport system ATP-binding protein
MGEANIVDAKVSSLGTGRVHADFGEGFSIELPDRGLPDGPAKVAIRPQAIAIQPADAASEGSLEAVVEAASYAGGRVEYSLRSRLGALLAWSDETERKFGPGTAVRVRLSGRGVTVVRP